MTAENSFNKSLLFVWSANGWEDQNMDSSFSSQTLIWRRHCSIGQSCSSMLSKWSSNWFLVSSLGMKFFHPSICLTNQKPCTFLSIISNETNQIALFACICFFLFCSHVFISRSYENCSLYFKAINTDVDILPFTRKIPYGKKKNVINYKISNKTN